MAGQNAQSRDILISVHDPPTKSHNVDDWQDVDYAYVHNQDISYIGLYEDNLDERMANARNNPSILEDTSTEDSGGDEVYTGVSIVNGEDEQIPGRLDTVEDDLLKSLLEEFDVSDTDLEDLSTEQYSELFYKLRQSEKYQNTNTDRDSEEKES
jgi:hypothetical protein